MRTLQLPATLLDSSGESEVLDVVRIILRKTESVVLRMAGLGKITLNGRELEAYEVTAFNTGDVLRYGHQEFVLEVV